MSIPEFNKLFEYKSLVYIVKILIFIVKKIVFSVLTV